ncbi:MAG: hypothetical protein KAQ85_11315 [Thermodesulfovibrionia bacterium]|nr:hypothetical protein [Thermodesulfovibrionia bacterium]
MPRAIIKINIDAVNHLFLNMIARPIRSRERGNIIFKEPRTENSRIPKNLSVKIRVMMISKMPVNNPELFFSDIEVTII